MATPRSAETLSPTSVQILLSLVSAPLHGYGIKLDIERRTAGAVSLGSGTLYQALARLEQQGLIAAAAPTAAADARRGRAYSLLPAGRRAVQRELDLMQRTVTSAAAQLALSDVD